MTHIKRWIIMLVLTIILVPTVKAETFTAKDDIIIDTKYYEFFKAQFGEDSKYKFFAYDCYYGNYNRTCYYGIDSKNNYVKIDYKNNSSSYQIHITIGVVENLTVNGVNVIEVGPTSISVIKYLLIFAFVLYIILLIF